MLHCKFSGYGEKYNQFDVCIIYIYVCMLHVCIYVFLYASNKEIGNNMKNIPLTIASKIPTFQNHYTFSPILKSNSWSAENA